MASRRAHGELSVRRRWLRLLVGLGVVAVVMAACGGASRSAGTASTDRLVIGQIGPGLGALAWMGRPQTVGARLAVQDINSAGGVLGKPVSLAPVEDVTAAHVTAVGD